MSPFDLRSHFSFPASSILIAYLALSACGGGGGSDAASSSNQAHTLNIGKPTASPGVIPPAASDTPVTFLSLVRGTAVPDHLSLDEVDSAGNVLVNDVAQLVDNGDGADHFRGDRVYSGNLMAVSVNSEEKHYRVRADRGMG